MNKVSGRLPMASSRRLSASINNKNQRPRSSYSLVSGTNSEDPNNTSFTSTNTAINSNSGNKENINAQMIDNSSIKGSFSNLDSNNNTKTSNSNDNNASLLIRQQSFENKMITSLFYYKIF